MTSGSFWEFNTPQGVQAVEVRPKLQSNDGAALYRACVQGLGIGMVSDYLARSALARGELVEVMPDIQFPDLWLKALVPLKRLDVPRIRVLLEWLGQHLRLDLALPEADPSPSN